MVLREATPAANLAVLKESRAPAKETDGGCCMGFRVSGSQCRCKIQDLSSKAKPFTQDSVQSLLYGVTYPLVFYLKPEEGKQKKINLGYCPDPLTVCIWAIQGYISLIINIMQLLQIGEGGAPNQTLNPKP